MKENFDKKANNSSQIIAETNHNDSWHSQKQYNYIKILYFNYDYVLYKKFPICNLICL
jgi:hypothetical protein